MSPLFVPYTWYNGSTISIPLSVAQLQQESWYGFFDNITSSLSGGIMNSYLSNDYALQLMRVGDETLHPYSELNPRHLPAVSRSEATIYGLPDLIALGGNLEDSGSDISQALSPPLGDTINPIAKVNFNAATTNWGNAAHADFKDLSYPVIWGWWAQFLTANSAMAVNDEA